MDLQSILALGYMEKLPLEQMLFLLGGHQFRELKKKSRECILSETLPPILQLLTQLVHDINRTSQLKRWFLLFTAIATAVWSIKRI